MRNPLTHQEIKAHLDAAYQLAVAANQATRTSNLQHIKNCLDRVESALKNTNLENLSAHTTRRLRRILTHKIPRTIRRATILYANKKTSFIIGKDAPWYLEDGLGRDHFEKAALKERGGRAKKQLKTITVSTPKVPAKAVVAAITSVAANSFPNLDFGNSDLNMQLQTLRSNWQRATQLPSQTSEDRFLLEQIATSYLPDSWAMHKEATITPGAAAKRANTLIRDQLETLNSRILEILGHSSDTALNRLEAQTNFIKQKQAITKTGILHIK